MIRPFLGESDLIPLVIHDENHAYRHQSGGHNENENPALQGLDHAGASRGCLGITKRAALGESWEGRGEHGESGRAYSE